MPSDLEKAIMQAAIAYFFYELPLCCRVAFVVSFESLALSVANSERLRILEKSRIGGASPAPGMM
jgi:hypothetical protein